MCKCVDNTCCETMTRYGINVIDSRPHEEEMPFLTFTFLVSCLCEAWCSAPAGAPCCDVQSHRVWYLLSTDPAYSLFGPRQNFKFVLFFSVNEFKSHLYVVGFKIRILLVMFE